MSGSVASVSRAPKASLSVCSSSFPLVTFSIFTVHPVNASCYVVSYLAELGIVLSLPNYDVGNMA